MNRLAPVFAQVKRAARTLDDGKGKGVLAVDLFGALFGSTKFAHDGRQGRLMVGNDGTTGGAGLCSHHAHKLQAPTLFQAGKPLGERQHAAIGGVYFLTVFRLIAGIGMARSEERRVGKEWRARGTPERV